MRHSAFVSLLRSLARTFGALLLLSSTVGGVLAATGATAPTTQAQATTRTFLPMVAKPILAPPPVDPTPGPPPPAANGGIFLDRSVKTASAATAIDRSGGYHAAHINYVPGVENPPASYEYCASSCANAANWQKVQLSNQAHEVQLALTPDGHPRLLIVTNSAVYSGGKDYNYAECNSSCTSAASWTVTRTFSSNGTSIFDIGNDRVPQRSFALDPQGRPRFFYQDRNYGIEPDHYGGFYAFCDAGCTNAANWQQTEVGRFINYDAEFLYQPSLTFTSAGQPRLTARVFAINPDGSAAETGLYYYECDSSCDQIPSWKRVFLIPTGGGSYPYPTWDLELDSSNRPRIAIFTGDGLQPAEFNNTVLYLWCNAGCLDSNNWQLDNLAFGADDGEGVDLELTAAGLPRLAYIDHLGNLSYAWCNGGCEADAAPWQHKIVETEAQVRAEFPQAIPLSCTTDLWNGLAPVLALDSAGNPRVAYDLTVDGNCLFDDPTDNYPPYSKFMPIWRAARLVFFTQP